MPASGLNPAEYQDQLANAHANSIDPNDPLPPGFFEGAVPAIGTGFERGELEVANLFAPNDADLIHDTLDMAKPNPRTTGWLGNALYGITSGLPAFAAGTVVGGPVGGAALLAASKGYAQTGDLEKQGVDSETATELGFLEGASQGVGAMLPSALGGSLMTRLASGAAMNAGFNAANRGATSSILAEHGYKDMAEQYKAFDAKAIFADAILGMAFAATHSGHRDPLPSEAHPATPEFRDWFANSKIVAPDGSPLVAYHGTTADIESFKPGGGGNAGAGIYFTTNPQHAAAYGAKPTTNGTGPTTYPVYLSIQNPKVIEKASFWERLRDRDADKKNRLQSSYLPQEKIDSLKAQGYDGLINKAADEIIAFHPTQIKSIHNPGTFDRRNPSIIDSPLPSEIDAALAANNAHNLELDTAPGIPADLATRNAHVDAMDTATQQLLQGEPVNVGEVFSDSNFIPKRDDVEARAGLDEAVKENGLDQLEMPAARSTSDEAGGAAMMSPTATLEGSQEPLFHSTDSSPPSGVFARASTAPSSLRGSSEGSSSRVIGESPAEPYHSVNHFDKLFDIARQNEPELEKHLQAIADPIPGAHFEGVRVKDVEEMKSKLQRLNREPDQVGDYLGGRIVVDTPAALEKTLNALRDRSDVSEIDDFLDRPKNGGYRAVHVQVRGQDGLSAEVQVIPAPVAEAKSEAQQIYSKYRRRGVQPDETAQWHADKAREAKLFNEAWQKWQEQSKAKDEVPASPAQQIATEKPNLQVATEDGTMTAPEALAKADGDIERAKKESGLFDVAINCFLRFGDEG